MIKNNKGVSLVGVVVSAGVIGVTILASQSYMVNSAKNLHKLRVQSSKQLIVMNLKAQAFSVSALDQTKNRNQRVKACSSGLDKCKDEACSEEPKDCQTGWVNNVEFYNGLGDQVSGSMFYNNEGQVCSKGLSFGSKCPFKVNSRMYFNCPKGSSPCIQAESAKISFSIESHSSIQKYVKTSSIEAEILKLSPAPIINHYITQKTINETINRIPPKTDSDPKGDGK